MNKDLQQTIERLRELDKDRIACLKATKHSPLLRLHEQCRSAMRVIEELVAEIQTMDNMVKRYHEKLQESEEMVSKLRLENAEYKDRLRND